MISVHTGKGERTNDLISRQAAIEELERKKDKDAKGDIGGFYNKIIQNDIDALTQLPSAQPEIIRCKECKHRPFDGEDTQGFGVEFPDWECPCHCSDGWYNWRPNDEWFCGAAERRTE